MTPTEKQRRELRRQYLYAHGGAVPTERTCEFCEYFDRHHGDCHNRLSPRFQTTAEQTCQHWTPST